MPEWNFTASKLFCNANKLIEAYQTVLQPLCKELGIPPMAVDILMFFANNPDSSTAKDLSVPRAEAGDRFRPYRPTGKRRAAAAAGRSRRPAEAAARLHGGRAAHH